jgi:hypothetical protein
LNALDIILEDIEKYMGDVVGFRLKINKPRIIGKHRKEIGDFGKAHDVLPT